MKVLLVRCFLVETDGVLCSEGAWMCSVLPRLVPCSGRTFMTWVHALEGRGESGACRRSLDRVPWLAIRDSRRGEMRGTRPTCLSPRKRSEYSAREKPKEIAHLDGDCAQSQRQNRRSDAISSYGAECGGPDRGKYRCRIKDQEIEPRAERRTNQEDSESCERHDRPSEQASLSPANRDEVSLPTTFLSAASLLKL
jgi:hypothetical protein